MPGKTLKTCHLSNEIFYSDIAITRLNRIELGVKVSYSVGLDFGFVAVFVKFGLRFSLVSNSIPI